VRPTLPYACIRPSGTSDLRQCACSEGVHHRIKVCAVPALSALALKLASSAILQTELEGPASRRSEQKRVRLLHVNVQAQAYSTGPTSRPGPEGRGSAQQRTPDMHHATYSWNTRASRRHDQKRIQDADSCAISACCLLRQTVLGLTDVSLEIAAGSRVLVIGGNGAGSARRGVSRAAHRHGRRVLCAAVTTHRRACHGRSIASHRSSGSSDGEINIAPTQHTPRTMQCTTCGSARRQEHAAEHTGRQEADHSGGCSESAWKASRSACPCIRVAAARTRSRTHTLTPRTHASARRERERERESERETHIKHARGLSESACVQARVPRHHASARRDVPRRLVEAGVRVRASSCVRAYPCTLLCARALFPYLGRRRWGASPFVFLIGGYRFVCTPRAVFVIVCSQCVSFLFIWFGRCAGFLHGHSAVEPAGRQCQDAARRGSHEHSGRRSGVVSSASACACAHPVFVLVLVMSAYGTIGYSISHYRVLYILLYSPRYHRVLKGG
jgi:hypothetical protein